MTGGNPHKSILSNQPSIVSQETNAGVYLTEAMLLHVPLSAGVEVRAPSESTIQFMLEGRKVTEFFSLRGRGLGAASVFCPSCQRNVRAAL